MKVHRFPILLALGALPWLGCAGTAKSTQKEAQNLLLDDQKDIQKAEQNYRDAVLHSGQNSKEANKALNDIDAARNKLQIDQQRVNQVQGIQFTPGTTGPAVTPPPNPAPQ